MLASLRISRQFLAATALVFSTAGFAPMISAADKPAKPSAAAQKKPAAKTLPFVNYDAIFSSEKFKDLEEFILAESVRPNLTKDLLHKAAKDGVKEYLEALPAGKKPTAADLETAALKGMFHSLTPHDGYLDKEEATAMRESMTSSFVGIGIEIDTRDKQIKVVSPIEGGPAEHAGIKAGDIVKEVDGTKLDGLEIKDSIKLMRGESGSRTAVKVLRDGALIEFKIVRASIKQTPVRYKMLEGGIAHIYVSEFANDVSTAVKYSIAQAKADAQLDPVLKAKGGLKGVILDMTFNPGGLLTESNTMSDDFLDKEGPVVTQQGRTDDHNERHSATFGDIIKGMNMVVLINEGSASASEIVAGALQDHERATIIGRPTFGKGTVQILRPLPDGTMFKVTTGIFKRPSGTSNQWIGVVPDVLVETRSKKLEEFSAKARTERSLPNSLPNEHGANAQKDKTKFMCTPVRADIKVEQAGTDKNIFFADGELNPYVACARDYLLKKADPAYTPRFTGTVPKAPALTN